MVVIGKGGVGFKEEKKRVMDKALVREFSKYGCQIVHLMQVQVKNGVIFY